MKCLLRGYGSFGSRRFLNVQRYVFVPLLVLLVFACASHANRVFAAGSSLVAWQGFGTQDGFGAYGDGMRGYSDGIMPMDDFSGPIGSGFDPGYPDDNFGAFEPEPVDSWFAYKFWDVSFEAGLNGSEGNSDTFNLHTGFDLKRSSDAATTKIKVRYTTTQTNRIKTQDNAIFKAGHEWFFPDSPWSAFLESDFLYDQFRAFDYRLVINGGVAYTHFKTEASTFKSRYGAGVSREFGGPDNSWSPEALFGLEYERQLTRRQKLNAAVDFFPEWGNFADYRIVSELSWELLVDDEANLSLKLDVTDRYDSTPNGARPNDITYALLLLWKL